MSQFGAEYDALVGSILNPPPTPPTITEQKKNRLLETRKNKLLAIAPDVLATEEEQAANEAALAAVPSYEDLYGEDGGGSNLIDAAQASIYKTGQSFGELGRDVASGLASSGGENVVSDYLEDIQFTPEEDVNKYVGYDPTETQAKMEAVGEAYDRGDVLDVIGTAIKATPNVLADSAGDLLTLGLGGAGIFAKGAKAAQKGAKTLKAEQALLKRQAQADIATTKAGTGYRMDTLKESLKARKGLSAKIASKETEAKMLNTFDNLIRINKSTLGLGAAYTNQQLNERKANNDGESASPVVAIGSFVANTVLFGAEFNIIKKVGGSVAKDLVEDLTVNTAKAALTGKSKDLAKAIYENTLKVAGAAGAEAAQEYAQTWTQILTEKAGTKEFGGVSDVIGDKENQKEANMGAILGAAAGGTLRAAPMAVTTPVKATAKIANKVVTKVAEKASEKAVEASYGLLSADERTQLKEQFEAEDTALEESNTARQAQINKIDKANTLEELRDLGDEKINEAIDNTIAKSKIAPKIIETIDKITGANTLETIAKASAYGRVLVDKMSTEDKTNPATVEQVKEKVLTHLNGRLGRSEQAVLTPRLETIKNAAIAQYNKDMDVSEALGKLTKGRDIVAKVTKNAYEKTKAKGQEIVDAIPPEVTENINKLVKEGKELTEETIETVVSNLKDTNKSIARALLDDLISDKPKKATLIGLSKLNLPTLEAIKTSVKSNAKANRIVNAAIERKKKVRAEFFGDTTVEKAKSKGKEAVDKAGEVAKKAAKAVKEKLKGLLGEDITNKISGLKGIIADGINDSETLEEVKALIQSIKDEGKELTKDAKETLEKIEEAVTVKAIELEQAAKKKTESKKETPEANLDLATMSLDEFTKASANLDQFMYSLTMDDIQALGKNPNIPESIKEAVTIEFINIQSKENEEMQTDEKASKEQVDELLNDEFIQQLQEEEGCK